MECAKRQKKISFRKGVMKKEFLAGIMLATLMTSPVFAQYVNGYYRSNGTYVQGYHRTQADSSRFNNYSTKGNYNPYTGERGHVDPYKNSYGYNSGYNSGYSRNNSRNDYY